MKLSTTNRGVAREASDAIIRPSKLAHVVVKTTRYEALVDWYITVLGADITHANDQMTFLNYDDEHHRLAILKVPGLLPNWRGSAGVDHFAFAYDSIGDLLTTYERLKREGIEPIWPINHGATLSLYYKDPDENVIELQVDAFATRAETDAFLQDGRFAINPVGIDVDPDDLLERWKNGASHEDLVRWPEVAEPRRTPPPEGYLGKLQTRMMKVARMLGAS